jgi:hypothetical protein
MNNPVREEPKAFEASAMFDCPADAADAAVALRCFGYELRLNPNLVDEDDGVILTPTVFGVIRGVTNLTEDEIVEELWELVRGLRGQVSEIGYVKPGRCTSFDPRHDDFLRAKSEWEAAIAAGKQPTVTGPPSVN